MSVFMRSTNSRRDTGMQKVQKKHLVILFGAASTFLRERRRAEVIAFRSGKISLLSQDFN